MLTRIADWKAPDYRPIYKERMERLQALRRDPAVLAAALKFYQTHPIEWIEDWAMTYDPRVLAEGRDPFLPLILFDRQREMIQWLYDREMAQEPGCIEKSRDTGITWCMAAYGTWAWCCRPSSAIGFGSYEVGKVDKLGDPNSILEKCRIILRNMPKELLPSNLDVDKDLMWMRLVNRESGATIIGEGGDKIGRGGRASVYFLDEAAWLAHPELVDASLAATSKCKIFASTAHGTGAFYRKIRGGNFPVFRFHWRQDPRKDDAWYKIQEETLDPITLAQEVDIDHTASVENVVIPAEWVQASRELHTLLADTARSRHGVAGLDVGGGKAKSVFVPRFGPVVDMPHQRKDGDTTATAHWARGLMQKTAVARMNFDVVGVGAGVASTLRAVGPILVKGPEPGPPPVLTRRQTIEEMVNRAAGAPQPNPVAQPKLVRSAVDGVNVGIPASAHTRWPDGKTSREKFANLKAEVWWIMRDRLQKTYEHWLHLNDMEGGQEHPIEDLLLLPDHDELCSQLSVLTWYPTAAGKIQMERKDQLKLRGVASPDDAEALSLTLVPERATLKTTEVEGAY